MSEVGLYEEISDVWKLLWESVLPSEPQEERWEEAESQARDAGILKFCFKSVIF